jgi:hypothetical protein
LASSGATPKRQAIQDPMDALSPVDAFLRHCLSLSAKCRPHERGVAARTGIRVFGDQPSHAEQ